jgi:hypothetical protein
MKTFSEANQTMLAFQKCPVFCKGTLTPQKEKNLLTSLQVATCLFYSVGKI